MVLLQLPTFVLWPLFDVAVALLDTLRVALLVSAPALLAEARLDD